MQRKRNRFKRWVNQQGMTALADKLGITRQAVSQWFRFVAQPSTPIAVRLVRMGRGAFDHNDIVRDTYRRRASKNL